MTSFSCIPSTRLTAISAVALFATSTLALGSGFYNLGQNVQARAASTGSNPVVTGVTPGVYFKWTIDGGLTTIGGDGLAGGQAGIDDAGTRISGTIFNPVSGKNEVGLYDIASGSWSLIGSLGFSCDASAASAWGLSGDGSTVVGLGWIAGCGAQAVYSIDGGPLVSLGTTVPGRSTRANGTSFDGSVIVGWQDALSGFRQGAFWDADGVQTILTFGGNPVGEAGAVSADGTAIVGSGGSALGGRAYRWTAKTGVQSLGSIFNSSWTGAGTGITADGSTVVGFYRPFGPAAQGEGFIWTEADGMQNLTTWVATQGITMPAGTVLALPLGISSDGRTIVGIGRIGSTPIGFAVVLPESETPCPADLDGNGVVDGADLGALLNVWGTNDAAADLNGDGIVDGADLGALLNSWGSCD